MLNFYGVSALLVQNVTKLANNNTRSRLNSKDSIKWQKEERKRAEKK